MDIPVEEGYLKKAMQLHHSHPVVDAHLDLAGEILLRHLAGESEVVKTHYLEHFHTAGIDLVVSSVYVENRNLEQGWENALAQIAALKEDIHGLEEAVLIRSKEELSGLWKNNAAAEDGGEPQKKKTGILLYMEGLDCIGEDVEKIQELYDLGVRGAALTWSRKNALATGCCTAARRLQIPGEITLAGKRAVRKLEELSMFVDVSHLNDEGYEQMLSLAERPLLATHSCSRAVYDSYRNMTDAQMEALAKKGGIMGVNGCKYIAGSLAGNHLEMLCRHMEYEVERIGAEHVGFGFDLCDSYDRAKAALQGSVWEESQDCLLHHGQVPLVTAALLQRGMEEKAVCQMIGENFMQYFQKVL